MTSILKTIRLQRKLSQEQMADDLSVSSNYISLIENGKRRPGMRFFEQVSSTYNVPFVVVAQNELIPEGKTRSEKEVRDKIIKLIADLEKIFLHA